MERCCRGDGDSVKIRLFANKNMDLLQMSSAVATVTAWALINRELEACFMFREEVSALT